MTVHKFNTFAGANEIVKKLKEMPVMAGVSSDGRQPCLDFALSMRKSPVILASTSQDHYSTDVLEEKATKFYDV